MASCSNAPESFRNKLVSEDSLQCDFFLIISSNVIADFIIPAFDGKQLGGKQHIYGYIVSVRTFTGYVF